MYLSIVALISRSWAEPTEPTPPEPVDLAQQNAELQQTIDALEAQLAESKRTNEAIAHIEALLSAASTLLDDRQDLEARADAARLLAGEEDPRVAAILWACALDRDAELQQICAEATLARGNPFGIELTRRALLDPETADDTRLALIDALGDHQSEGAAALLLETSQTREIRASVRSSAVRTLEQRYSQWLTERGGAPRVIDPLGGMMFVTANGLLGGIVFSSVGVWGELDAGPALGAVGGSAIGLGGSAIYAGARPLTTGQGLAYGSGVTWGLVYGVWTTTAVHGAWRWIDDDDEVRRPAAGYRALGVLAGAGVGLFGMRRDPSPWDVLEVDTAGYLGSAIALGVTAVTGYRQPDELYIDTPYGYGYLDRDTAYEKRASQRHAASELVGATTGLVGGYLLADRWTLQPQDALFGVTIGGQAALLGNFVPDLWGADKYRLKGYIRLPWNVGIAGGLLLAEFQPMPYDRSLSALWTSAAADALAAGLPLLAGRTGDEAVAPFLVPLGLLGTTGGILAHPLVDPSAGDWTLSATATSMVVGQSVLVGAALEDLDVWTEPEQASGLVAVSGGLVGLSVYGLGTLVDPRVDQWLLIGCAAGWGGFYGGLVPYGAGVERDAATLLSSAATSAVFAGGIGTATALGLHPRDTLVPQVLAGTGATVGSLGVALGSSDGRDAALGAVIGASLGFGLGASIEWLVDPTPPRKAALGLRRRGVGTWMPLFEAYPGIDGRSTPIAGVRAIGW